MHETPLQRRSRRRLGAWFFALLLVSAPVGLAQSEPRAQANSDASQVERGLEAARRAAGANATATPDEAGSAKTNAGGAAGTGAIGTGAAGTGTSGTGAGGVRPGADSMERSRERNMPGATPGSPAVSVMDPNAGGAPGTVDMDPPVGGISNSQSGAALGGLPSDGGPRPTNGAHETRRDSRTTARMIGETSFAYRDRAMTMAERELAAGNAISSSILRGSANLSGPARTRVDDSVARANAARTELSKAISRARSANEARWEPSRSEVVNRYEDYVKALEDARAAATEGGVRLPDAAGTSATTPAPR